MLKYKEKRRVFDMSPLYWTTSKEGIFYALQLRVQAEMRRTVQGRKGSCATQGEKAAIVKELRENGHQLKHLLQAMGLSRSTYYYEISKEDEAV